MGRMGPVPSSRMYAMPTGEADALPTVKTSSSHLNRSFNDATVALKSNPAVRIKGGDPTVCSRRTACMGIRCGFFYVALILAMFCNVSLAVKRVRRDLIIPPQLSAGPSPVIHKRADTAPPPVMDCFQVSPVVKVPASATSQCQQTLMVYSFTSSYGKPFVGE
jgi:hypothetical protein